jgi:hypothetical protein
VVDFYFIENHQVILLVIILIDDSPFSNRPLLDADGPEGYNEKREGNPPGLEIPGGSFQTAVPLLNVTNAGRRIAGTPKGQSFI